MTTYIDWIRFITLVHRALADGATVDLPRIFWDVSLGCENSYQVSVTSYPPNNIGAIQHINDSAMDMRRLYMDTPCRKCPTCLRNRQRLWTKRSKYELARAPRTWFCTWTIEPEWRFRFSLQTGSRDYIETYKVISKEMTKMWKRLRSKQYFFRYLMVAEAHKDGYPHIHAFIHECWGHAPVPKRAIQAEWPYGFTTVKLVDTTDQKACYYVTKYISKDARTRIRSSQAYGLEGAVCTSSQSPF